MTFEKSKREYALRFASSLVGHIITSKEVNDAQCIDIFEALSRSEEIMTTDRDHWGGWDWQYCNSQRRGELYVPWIDRPLAQLREVIQSQVPQWQLEPLWPEKKRFALCLTHDVDVVLRDTTLKAALHTIWRDFQSDFTPRAQFGRARVFLSDWLRDLRSNTSRTLHNFDAWLRLEDAFNFKSTFFFFPSRFHSRHPYDCDYQFHEIVRHGGRTMTVREMIKTIDLAGWEIGLHGSYHSATEWGLLSPQRLQLEEIIGHEIISIRQHWLHYDVQATARLQRDAGFKADSTQGFNRSIGFRAGTAFPYWCWDHQKNDPLPVLEIPQHIMDGGLFIPNGLQYNEALAIKHSVEIMDAVERVGGCLTLSWHPHNVNDSKHWVVYKTLLEEAARRNAWGCSMGELYRWWMDREQRVLGLMSKENTSEVSLPDYKASNSS
jgi:peptidoglycan/xylan/chitin deacetylase (PgdA/CDA1 family)